MLKRFHHIDDCITHLKEYETLNLSMKLLSAGLSLCHENEHDKPFPEKGFQESVWSMLATAYALGSKHERAGMIEDTD